MKKEMKTKNSKEKDCSTKAKMSHREKDCSTKACSAKTKSSIKNKCNCDEPGCGCDKKSKRK